MRIAIAGATGLVGRDLVPLARAGGHDVVGISRAHGVDLVAGTGIDEALAGVEAVIDATNSPTVDETGASDYFATAAANLGRAATAAGVTRTVVLSIVGIDLTPEGYYAAKLAHERSTLEHAPGPRVLRAAQFHEFAEQSLGWGRDGAVCAVQDMPVQPVALAVVARALLDLATTAEGPRHVDLAGPHPELLTEMVTRLIAHRGERLAVKPVPVNAAIRAGALLPGPGATLAGPGYDEWLAARPSS